MVSVVWSYAGLSPQQLSDRIVVQFERNMTTTVNDIEHTESQTLNGVSVIKIYFRPAVNISQAVAQITSSGADGACASILRARRLPWLFNTAHRVCRCCSLGSPATG